MSDSIQIVMRVIKANDLSTVGELSGALGALMNRRNQNIFWQALIDKATHLHGQSKMGDALAMTRIFMSNHLEANVPLDNGSMPINVLMARSPSLAAVAIREMAFDVNLPDRAGRTPAMWGVELAKSKSIDVYETLIALARTPSFDLKVGDQGAAMCFKGLAWAPTSAAFGDPELATRGARGLVDALASKGYDFNAARETPDVKIGSTINTPLAYCIKKAAHWLEWSGKSSKSERVGAVVWSIAQDLIAHGADPCLQMEPGQHVQLMDVCRKANFPKGMMQSLEAGLLEQIVASVDEKKPAPRRL